MVFNVAILNLCSFIHIPGLPDRVSQGEVAKDMKLNREYNSAKSPHIS